MWLICSSVSCRTVLPHLKLYPTEALALSFSSGFPYRPWNLYVGLQCFTFKSKLHVQSTTMPMPPPCSRRTVNSTKNHMYTCCCEICSDSHTCITGRTYHLGNEVEVKAREFDNVSQFEYWTERSVVWMIKTFADVCWVNTLHQVTPGRTTVWTFRSYRSCGTDVHSKHFNNIINVYINMFPCIPLGLSV